MKKAPISYLLLAVFTLSHLNSSSGISYGAARGCFPALKTQRSWVGGDIYQLVAAILNYFAGPVQEPEVAQVRRALAHDLCAQEARFLRLRDDYTREALQTFLAHDASCENAPRVALCFSGGGFRAMTASLGFLKGAEEIGLLDTVSYMAGLSGSTWALAGWIASGKSISDYIAALGEKTKYGMQPIVEPAELENISGKIVEKFLHGQPFSIIDLYGDLLAHMVLRDFGPDRYGLTLRQTHARATSGALPLPIYTCVSPDVDPYAWFEFTPFEMGSTFTKTFIPTWAFGKKFSNGVARGTCPELSLGYLMGIYGSAFDVGVSDVVRFMGTSLWQKMAHLPLGVQTLIEKLLQDAIHDSSDDIRFAPSNMLNPSFGLKDDPLTHQEILTLIDAGIDCNIPFMPLLHPARAIDVIIVYDASAENQDFGTLLCAKSLAIQHKLRFPEINLQGLDKQLVHVFEDEKDPLCPVVIYFPMKKNEAYSLTFDPIASSQSGYCSTYNFKYSQANIDELAGLTEFTIKQHADLIKQVIVQKANMKK